MSDFDDPGFRVTPTTPPLERLTAFLYRLMRDEVPTGVIEDHLRVVEDAHDRDAIVRYVGEAGPVGEYARAVAERLLYYRDRMPDE